RRLCDMRRRARRNAHNGGTLPLLGSVGVPWPDDDGAIPEVRNFWSIFALAAATAGLCECVADAQLRAHDALGPDHGLLITARARVRQPAQCADDDDVVVR